MQKLLDKLWTEPARVIARYSAILTAGVILVVDVVDTGGIQAPAIIAAAAALGITVPAGEAIRRRVTPTWRAAEEISKSYSAGREVEAKAAVRNAHSLQDTKGRRVEGRESTARRKPTVKKPPPKRTAAKKPPAKRKPAA